MDLTPESITERVEDRYLGILAECRQVPAADLVSPALPNGWSAKDALANIAAWVWRCAALLNHAHDSNQLLKAKPDEKGLNDEFHLERHDWPWEAVEADFRMAHQALLDAVHHLPPTRFDDPIIQQTLTQEIWNRHAAYLPRLEGWLAQQAAVALPRLGPHT